MAGGSRALQIAVAAAAAAVTDAGVGYGALSLQACNVQGPSGYYQVWDYVNNNIQVRKYELWGTYSSWSPEAASGPSSSGTNATVWAQPGGGGKYAMTADTPSTTIVDQSTNLCLEPMYGNGVANAAIWMQPCQTGSAAQAFSYNTAAGTVTHVASGLCVDGGSPLMGCLPGSPSLQFPYCNASLTVDDRIADLIGRLTIEEKASMLDTSSGGSAGAALEPIQWWNEALHGIANNVGVAFIGSTPFSTSFPMPILTSCSFNTSLWRAIGEAVSTEARAFANAGHAGLTYWAPNINMFRDPRWGRGQETPGEDPLLSGAYATNFVRGMQEGPDPRYLKTSSCIKHYAGYSLELWEGMDRHHFNAVVPDADLVEYYLPAFQTGVQAGHASSIMCSYNAVNGVPSCANGFLMSTIARGQWGFDGYITSDCGAVTDIPDNHMYTNSSDGTAAATLKAGMDIGCDQYLAGANVITNALADGAITMQDVDTAMAHLLRVRFRLGEFDPASMQPYRSIPSSVICSDDHQALSRDAARQSIVMLENINSSLPLTRSAMNSVAVVGPIANNSITNGGPNYNGIPCGGGAITVLQAMQAQASPSLNVRYAPGCANVACADNSGFAAAASAAASSDFTIVVVGIDQTIENEGLDRVGITLPGLQNQLISQTCQAARGPCILVVMSGGSQDISSVVGDVSAAFYAGFLGGNGALALADIIFGDAVPAGRLTQTFYSADFINEVSMFEMGVRPGPSSFPPGTNPGRSYRWYTGTPVYPFGYGMSYTTFEVKDLSGPAVVDLAPVQAYLDSAASPDSDSVALRGSAFVPMADDGSNPTIASYSVNITNTGNISADYACLGFLIPPGAGTGGVPLQTLFGFARAYVPAGQTVNVWLGLTARDLTRVVPASAESQASIDADLNVIRVAQAGKYGIRIGVRGPNTQESEIAELEFEAVAA